MPRIPRNAGGPATSGAYVAPARAGHPRFRECPKCGAKPHFSCMSTHGVVDGVARAMVNGESTGGGWIKPMKGYHAERKRSREVTKES